MNELGVRVEDNEGMRIIIGDYFKNIFTRVDTKLAMDSDTNPRLVIEALNKQLMEEVTFEELTNAIFGKPSTRVFGKRWGSRYFNVARNGYKVTRSLQI